MLAAGLHLLECPPCLCVLSSPPTFSKLYIYRLEELRAHHRNERALALLRTPPCYTAPPKGIQPAPLHTDPLTDGWFLHVLSRLRGWLLEKDAVQRPDEMLGRNRFLLLLLAGGVTLAFVSLSLQFRECANVSSMLKGKPSPTAGETSGEGENAAQVTENVHRKRRFHPISRWKRSGVEKVAAATWRRDPADLRCPSKIRSFVLGAVLSEQSWRHY